MEYYELKVGGLTRQLPIMQVSDTMRIAAFISLGDSELISRLAPLLIEKMPEVDIVLTAETKGIPIAHEVSRLLGKARYCVARKTLKPYMNVSLTDEVFSISTQKLQTLYLDQKDVALLKGKRVAIVDDVISTGESLKAMERLVDGAGGHVVAKVGILAEGEAAERKDIIFLEPLPLFPIEE